MEYQWRVTWQGASGEVHSDLRMTSLQDIWRGFEMFPGAWKWAVLTRVA